LIGLVQDTSLCLLVVVFCAGASNILRIYDKFKPTFEKFLKKVLIELEKYFSAGYIMV
jgi:hypothetical protein